MKKVFILQKHIQAKELEELLNKGWIIERVDSLVGYPANNISKCIESILVYILTK